MSNSKEIHLVIGAGGLSKQALSSLKSLNDKCDSELVFFDNVSGIEDFYGYRVIHDFSEIYGSFDFTICLGNPKHREIFYNRLTMLGGDPINVISENSLLYECCMGKGNLILPYSLLEPGSKIGENNLINCYSGIFHDVTIGDNNEIMPGARILGSSSIGSKCRIGSNSTILPNISICDGAIVGAGAVVTSNIEESGTYVGVPAKRIK